MSNSFLDLVDVNAESAEGILFKGASVPFGMMVLPALACDLSLVTIASMDE
jgi:hypothetical protein